jgi:hypothetical protein
LERQRKLNEDRRRRDEEEIDLAADFALHADNLAAAREAVHAAELAMGRLVDTLIGEWRVRYPRAAQLLDQPEDELRRLRQLAADSLHNKESRGGHGSRSTEPTPKNRASAGRQAIRPREETAVSPGTAAVPETAEPDGDGPIRSG